MVSRIMPVTDTISSSGTLSSTSPQGPVEDPLRDPLADPLETSEVLPPIPTPAPELVVSGTPEDEDAHRRWAGGLGALNALADRMAEAPLGGSELMRMLGEIRESYGFKSLTGGVEAETEGWWLEGDLNPKVKTDTGRTSPSTNPYARTFTGSRREKKVDETTGANFQALRLFLDDTNDPPTVDGYSFIGGDGKTGTVLATPENPEAVRTGRTIVRDSYTVQMRAYETDDTSGYKTYKVEIPHEFLETMGLSTDLPTVLSSSFHASSGNPFGRFEENKNVYIKLDKSAFNSKAIKNLEEKLKGKYGDGHLLDTSDSVPGGYKLDHTSGLGFEVYVPDTATDHGATTLSQTEINGLVTIATTRLTGISVGDRSSTGGSKTGESNKARLRKFEGRNRGDSQTKVMGGSPNDVAATLGLPTSWSWEWLHLIAHHFGGGDGKPQVATNLVLGTDHANSRMLEIEEGLATALRGDRMKKVEFDVKPTLLDSRVPWLASKITYGIKIDGKVSSEEFYPLNNAKPPVVGLETARELAGNMV